MLSSTCLWGYQDSWELAWRVGAPWGGGWSVGSGQINFSSEGALTGEGDVSATSGNWLALGVAVPGQQGPDVKASE